MKLSLFYWLGSAAMLVACAGPAPIPLVGGAQAPAAQGNVVASPDENGNTRVTVQVQHLAPPERVMPEARVWVAWVERPDAVPQNVGALRVDQNLTGRLRTVTPYQSFTLSISPESSPMATAPHGPRVLTATVAQ